MNGSRSVGDGKCLAWSLPADATCAKAARRLFTDVACSLRLPEEMVEDGILMASELAANTLHVRGCGGGGQHGTQSAGRGQGVGLGQGVRPGALGDGPGPRDVGRGRMVGEALLARPEMWLYLRSSDAGRELVCKIFDGGTGWGSDDIPLQHEADDPVLGEVSQDGEDGRGLQVVHELSGGHWGFHLSRSRLGGGRGKVVWFAQPLPPVTALPRRPMMTAAEAARDLQAALDARGFAGRLVRADDPAGNMSVISVSEGLAVWCRAGVAWLREPGQEGLRWSFGDLVEVAEQAVRAYEELGHDRPQLCTVAPIIPAQAGR
jgi:hypothetical protein